MLDGIDITVLAYSEDEARKKVMNKYFTRLMMKYHGYLIRNLFSLAREEYEELTCLVRMINRPAKVLDDISYNRIMCA